MKRSFTPVHPAPRYCRFSAELGHRVIVANPRKVRATYQSERKSDRNDAVMLARVSAGRFTTVGSFLTAFSDKRGRKHGFGAI